ncbi:TPA: hypothetical protein ACH3X2_009926 [Trebouxia sp. C0005]
MAPSHYLVLQNSGGFCRPSTQSRNKWRLLIAAFTSWFHNIQRQSIFLHSRTLLSAYDVEGYLSQPFMGIWKAQQSLLVQNSAGSYT